LYLLSTKSWELQTLEFRVSNAGISNLGLKYFLPGSGTPRAFSQAMKSVNVRSSTGNVLLLLMLAAGVGAALLIQRDRAATSPSSLDVDAVTRIRLEQALLRAKALDKHLMVVFGGDWCEDCVVLNRNLGTGETRDYFEQHFILLQVEVDNTDRNLSVAKSLNAGVEHGVPAAVFFAPDGARIGGTTRGELEPSRNYTPAQILEFLKAVVERRTIVNPAHS